MTENYRYSLKNCNEFNLNQVHSCGTLVVQLLKEMFALTDSSDTTTPDCEAIIKNLTKEEDIKMNELGECNAKQYYHYYHCCLLFS